MAKLPAFQFYPADWLNDIKLQVCSLTSKGALIDLMCLMHQSEKYGYLLINGSIPDHKTIIKLLRTHHKTFKKALSELLSCGALKQDDKGCLYCERMVKDQALRDIRKVSGSLGGNPVLLNQKVNQKDKQKTTPSSSSSASPSIITSKEDGKPSIDEIIEHGSYNLLDKNIRLIAEELYQSKKFSKVHAFMNTHMKKKSNKRAILKAFTALSMKPKIEGEPWAYCEKVMQIQNGNFNEKDASRTA